MITAAQQWNGPGDSNSIVSHRPSQIGVNRALHEDLCTQLNSMAGQMAITDTGREHLELTCVFPGCWLVVHDDGRREVLSDAEYKKRIKL